MDWHALRSEFVHTAQAAGTFAPRLLSRPPVSDVLPADFVWTLGNSLAHTPYQVLRRIRHQTAGRHPDQWLWQSAYQSNWEVLWFQSYSAQAKYRRYEYFNARSSTNTEIANIIVLAFTYLKVKLESAHNLSLWRLENCDRLDGVLRGFQHKRIGHGGRR